MYDYSELESPRSIENAKHFKSMYEEAGIAPLSKTQISKLLNHHSVRVKPGQHHKVHLSKEQMKKHLKSMQKGVGYTLTLDPYQRELHQHLRQGNSAIKALSGHDIMGEANHLLGGKVWRTVQKNIGHDISKLAEGGTNYLLRKMEGGKVRRGRPRKHIAGGKVNRAHKFDKWMGKIGHVIESVGDYIKPVAKPILSAATRAAVNKINTSGMGVHSKRRGRPRKHIGEGIIPAGTTAPSSGFGMKKKSHRKKAMHFAL